MGNADPIGTDNLRSVLADALEGAAHALRSYPPRDRVDADLRDVEPVKLVEDGARLTLTVEETAQRLGIGRSAAYEAVRAGTIPSLKIGRRRLIPIAALQRQLAELSRQ